MSESLAALGHLLAALTTAAVFGLAAYGKLRDPDSLQDALSGIGVRAPRLGWAVSRGVIAGEILVVVLLLVPAARVVGLALALASLAGYSLAIVVMLRRGVGNCACFGTGSERPSHLHIARNAVLGALCALGIATAGDVGALGGAGLALGAGMALWLSAVLVRFPEVVRTLLEPFAPPT